LRCAPCFTDFVEFDEDGRISGLTMFYDSSPEEAGGEEL
jgi:hypothetical protein